MDNTASHRKSSSTQLNKATIAIFLPTLNGGGAQQVMVYLANNFYELGYTVHLVLVKAEGPFLSLAKAGIKIINLDCSRTISCLFRLTKYINDEKPDVFYSTLDHTNILAILAKKISKWSPKLIIRIANNLKESTSSSKDIRYHITLFLLEYLYPLADSIIAVSQDLASELITIHNLPKKKIKVIYNPLPIMELVDKANEPLKHPWISAAEDPIVLGVGRLTKQKDFTNLIYSISRLNRTCSVKLIILGEGEERSELEQLIQMLGIEEKVSLPGFVDNPFQYMKHASVFVLSSQWEGLPNVLLQAMACGTPVVSTDCPNGPREILENGRWGKLVPVGDHTALTQAILESLNGKNKCPTKEQLEHRFGTSFIIEQHLSLISDK